MLRAFGAHDHIATVTSTRLITPHYLRVWLHPETLFDAVLRNVRARLKKELGFGTQSQCLQAYWVRGREMRRLR